MDKSRVYISTQMDKELRDRLKRYAKTNRLLLEAVFSAACAEFLKRKEAK